MYFFHLYWGILEKGNMTWKKKKTKPRVEIVMYLNIWSLWRDGSACACCGRTDRACPLTCLFTPPLPFLGESSYVLLSAGFSHIVQGCQLPSPHYSLDPQTVSFELTLCLFTTLPRLPHPASPWQPLFYSLFLWVWFFFPPSFHLEVILCSICLADFFHLAWCFGWISWPL